MSSKKAKDNLEEAIGNATGTATKMTLGAVGFVETILRTDRLSLIALGTGTGLLVGHYAAKAQKRMLNQVINDGAPQQYTHPASTYAGKGAGIVAGITLIGQYLGRRFS